MALEKGIASLVEAFIAAGRPSSRDQHIDDRRAGYIASAVLAGETETRVRVEDITGGYALPRRFTAHSRRPATHAYLLPRRLFCQRRLYHPR